MKTAVCFTGNGRSIFALKNQEVFNSFKKNIINCWEDRDVYYILGANDRQDEIVDLFSTIDNCKVIVTCHEDLNISGIRFSLPPHNKEVRTTSQSLAKFLYKRKVLGETLKNSNVNYDRVIISRDDVLYSKPVSEQVKNLDLSKLWVPYWGCWMGGLNDRFSISNQKIQETYCEAWDHRTEVCKIHIESFYRYHIQNYIGMDKVGFFNAEFVRVRPSGRIEQKDLDLSKQSPFNPMDNSWKIFINR